MNPKARRRRAMARERWELQRADPRVWDCPRVSQAAVDAETWREVAR